MLYSGPVDENRSTTVPSAPPEIHNEPLCFLGVEVQVRKTKQPCAGPSYIIASNQCNRGVNSLFTAL